MWTRIYQFQLCGLRLKFSIILIESAFQELLYNLEYFLQYFVVSESKEEALLDLIV